MLHVT